MNIVYCLVKVFRQGVYFASPPSRSGRCDFCFDHGHRNAIKNVKFWAHLSDTRKPPQLSIVSCIQLKKGGCYSVPVGHFYKFFAKVSPAQSNFNLVGWAEETSLSTFIPHPLPLRKY